MTDGLNKAVQQEHRIVDAEETEQEDQTDGERDLRKDSDAVLQATDDGDARNTGDDPDDQALRRRVRASRPCTS